MSAEAPPAATAPSAREVDPLRLTFCPQCDYSLNGLPPEGICPECGATYDQEFVVIRAGLSGSRFGVRFGQTGAWVLWGLSTVLWLGLLALLFRTSRHDPAMLLMFGYLLFIAAWEWLDRLMSPRPRHLLVWIAPDGIGQGGSTDVNAPGMRLRRRISFGVLMLLWIGMMAVSRDPAAAIGVITPLVVLGLVALLQRATRPKLARPASEARPALLAWESLKKIRLWHYHGEHHRLRVETKGFLSSYPIDIVFGAAGEQVDELRSRLADWSGKPMQS